MSSSQIGGIVGAAVGSFIPGVGTQLGWTLGSMAGGLLGPKPDGLEDQQGQRLNDLKVSSSAYGAPIPKVFGNYRIAGNFIWATPIREVKNEREEAAGKGSSSESYTVTWYTYDATFALGLCEGEIESAVRIWADGMVIYEKSTSGGRLWTCPENIFADEITFYSGSATQDRNWVIQAAKPDTPAYRHTAYILFSKLQLEAFGNRIPSITVELAEASERNIYADAYQTYMEEIPTSVPTIRRFYQPNCSKYYGYKESVMFMEETASSIYRTWFMKYGILNPVSRSFTSLIEGKQGDSITSGNDGSHGDHPMGWSQGSSILNVYETPAVDVYNHDESIEVTNGATNLGGMHYISGSNAKALGVDDALISFYPSVVDYNTPSRFYTWLTTGEAYDYDSQDSAKFGTYTARDMYAPRAFFHDYCCCTYYNLNLQADIVENFEVAFYMVNDRYKVHDKILLESLPQWDLETNRDYMNAIGNGGVFVLPGLRFYCILKPTSGPQNNGYRTYNDMPTLESTSYNGLYRKKPKRLNTWVSSPGLQGSSTDWECHAFSFGTGVDNYYVLKGVRYDVPSLVDGITIPINIAASSKTYCHIIYDEKHIYSFGKYSVHRYNYINNTNEIFPWIWHNEDYSSTTYEVYLNNRRDNLINVCEGVIYATSSDVRRAVGHSSFGGHWHMCMDIDGIQIKQITLDTVVSSLLLSSGLSSGDFDVTGLASVDVNGYLVSKPMSGRDAISTLQTTYMFDLIEKDFKLVAILRDSTIDGHVLEEDMISFELTSSLDTELPTKITLKYTNRAIDFQVASQSAKRIDGNSDYDMAYDLPINLFDKEAKDLAYSLLFNSWSGKYRISFSIPFRSDLTVGDLITVSYDGFTYTVRISELVFNTDLSIKIEGTTEADSVYIQDEIAESTSTGFIPSVLPDHTNLIYRVINAPLLKNHYSDKQGLYVAVGALSEGFRSCHILISSDGGQSYTREGFVTDGTSVIGYATSLLLSGSSTAWDMTNTIDVSVVTFSQFESKTIEDVVNGANYVMVGNEIIQYTDVTLVAEVAKEPSAIFYRLSGLLRGRRGTEWAMESHEIGEDVVSLGNNLVFMNCSLNKNYSFKAVPIGFSANFYDQKLESCHGKNLIPFTVSNLFVEYSGNDDIISWVRRDRYINGFMATVPLTEQEESYEIRVFSYRDEKEFKLLNSIDFAYIVPKPLLTITTANTSYTLTEAEKTTAGIADLNTRLMYLVVQTGLYHYSVDSKYILKHARNEIYLSYLTSIGISHFFRLDEREGTTLYNEITSNNFITTSASLGLAGVSSNSPNASALLTGKTSGYLSGFTNNNNYDFSIVLSFNVKAGSQLLLAMGSSGVSWSSRSNWALTVDSAGSFNGLGTTFDVSQSSDTDWVTAGITFDGTTKESKLYIEGLLVDTHESLNILLYGSYFVSAAYMRRYNWINSKAHLDEVMIFTSKLNDEDMFKIYDHSRITGQ